jgi:hypothetical protein
VTARARQNLFVALIGAATLSACLEANQVPVSFDLHVAGHEVEPSFAGRDGWQIELERAELAFGPLYLCPGARAGALCEEARAEFTESVVVDLLVPDPIRAGNMVGVTGSVRSWMYDLGLPSVLTQDEPLVLDAARALGGHSLRVEGVAQRDDVRIPFVAEVAVQREPDTEQGMPLVRKGGSARFRHEITAATRSLTLRFDVRPWLGDVDFATLGCDTEPGCAAPVRFERGGQAWRAVRTALVAGAPPEFIWSSDP